MNGWIAIVTINGTLLMAGLGLRGTRGETTKETGRMNTIEPRSGAALNRHRSKQDYSTPQNFINAVEARFGPLAFDLAASAENAKANHYLTKENDSLSAVWSNLGVTGIYWLNPPFENIAPWARKCAMESTRGLEILFLVPASVGSNWFEQHVHGHAFVYFLNGRLCFNGIDGYPKDCILAHYKKMTNGQMIQGYAVWKWK